MKDSKFTVHYDHKVLTLILPEEVLSFDLKKGDVGDFWYSFDDKDGKLWDVNFAQEDVDDRPVASIYPIVNNTTDTSNGISLICMGKFGDPKKYFK